MEGVIEPATFEAIRQPCWQLSQANDSLGSFLGLGLEPGTLFLAHAAHAPTRVPIGVDDKHFGGSFQNCKSIASGSAVLRQPK